MDDITLASGAGICVDEIPAELRELPQWVLWRYEERGGKVDKIPYAIDGKPASSTDPATWTTCDEADERCAIAGTYSGIGYVFAADDPYVGIDLDGCRDPATGFIEPWALAWIERIDSYCEISPSRTGFKIVCRGTNPKGTGGNVKIDEPNKYGKDPGVEIYDRGRYFTITGWHVPGTPTGCEPRQAAVDEFVGKYWPKAAANANPSTIPYDAGSAADRCRSYVAKMPSAISGQAGHNATLTVACECFRFGLTDAQAAEVLAEYNARCEPPWNDRELAHKLESARGIVLTTGEFGSRLREERQNHPVGNLRDVSGGTPLRESGNGQAATVKAATTTTAPEPPAFTRLMTSAELVKLDLRSNFLIRNCLVEGQPCVFGGRSKTLKTSNALDAGVSLASGTPFLGRFDVPEKKRVAFWSGESGAMTLRDTARRIAESKQVKLADCDLLWCFDLPKLSRGDQLSWFEETLVKHSIQVAFIDPLYLCLLDGQQAGQASNVYAMGSLLQPLSAIGQRTGTTLVVLHHFKKSGQSDDAEPASLEMLSQAGIVEWARQWLLLERRSPYAANGEHELWMRVGGSSGHCGLYAIDISEGTINPDTLEGRHWGVTVGTVGDAIEHKKKAAEERKIKAAEERDADDTRKMLEALRKFPEGATMRDLRELAGLNGVRGPSAICKLLADGKAEHIAFTKNGRKESGYKPKL